MISVIIPVYNIPTNYLTDCLESVLSQSYLNIEVIIINDCSPNPDNDDTISTYASRDARIVYIALEKNGGVSNARNIGIAKATGEWIMFMDADDTFFDKFSIEHLFNQTSDDVDMISAYDRTELTVDGKKYVDEPFSQGKYSITGKDEEFIKALDSWHAGPCRKLIRKKMLENLKFPVGITHFEDFTFFWHVVLQKPTYILHPELVYIARCRPGSVTRSAKTVKYFVEIIKSCSYATTLLQDLFHDQPKTSKHLMKFILRECIVKKDLFDGLKRIDFKTVLPLLENLSYSICSNQYSTPIVKLIVKIRLLSFKVGIINYPKPLYYIIRSLYKYCL